MIWLHDKKIYFFGYRQNINIFFILLLSSTLLIIGHEFVKQIRNVFDTFPFEFFLYMFIILIKERLLNVIGVYGPK